MPSQKALDRHRRQLIRLRPLVHHDRDHPDVPRKHRRDRGSAVSPRIITIQHQQHLIEVHRQQVGLMSRDGRPHERHDRGIARLMDGQRIKETFNDNYCACPCLQHPTEIEEDERFSEANRESILRFFTVNRAARVGNQRTVLIVDGNHDPTTEKPAAAIEAHAKRPDRLRGQAACAQTGDGGRCAAR
jgi:hypothetical protein